MVLQLNFPVEGIDALSDTGHDYIHAAPLRAAEPGKSGRR